MGGTAVDLYAHADSALVGTVGVQAHLLRQDHGHCTTGSTSHIYSVKCNPAGLMDDHIASLEYRSAHEPLR